MKKYFIILAISLIFITGCSSKEEGKFTIVTTNFPCYDLARAVSRNTDVKIEMLLKPGSEVHDFEPTPQDIIKIKNSKVFIYVGGESDEWVNEILKDVDSSKTRIIKLLDLVETLNEEVVEGMEADEEGEIDEHIWTNPVNVKKMTQELTKEMIELDEVNKNEYVKNMNYYVNELNKINSEIKDVVKNGKRKELIFGDRFPFRYFANEYGLTYYAAFPGCSEASEASAKTISFLVKKIEEDKVPVILYIELSNKKIAETISKETGAKILEFNSAHNISKTDFEKGITYVDIMKNNIAVLKEALN